MLRRAATHSNNKDAVVTTAEICQSIRQAYEQGRYVSACDVGREAWGALSAWPGVEAQVLALRLAANLGAPRLADWLARAAHRSEPAHAEARYYEARRIGRRRGPYEGLRWMRRSGELPPNAASDIVASWYTLWGEFASIVRDFETAEIWFQRAEEADPGNPWVKVCRASSREREDRYDEAEQLAREALAIRPHYRPAVQMLGQLLTVLGRDEESIEFLKSAASEMECFSLHAQLVGMLVELKRYAEARESLDQVEKLAVLAEKPLPQWIAGNRGEIAYFLGEIDESIRWSRLSDSKFWKTIADRLENPEFAQRKSVTLAVGFVRQHHVTCAPATLSALSRFWGMPADHLQVADEICYNGTSSYSERKWAREHGWEAREFSVTEESAQALIDRGIPFTFTTVDPGNSHLQAVIGYDGRRGTLVIRDPYWRSTGEALATQLLERYRATGPRGMAMAPANQAHLLDAVELPDVNLWNRLHVIDEALIEHRREDARREFATMSAESPEHRLVSEARRRLAIYDGNAAEQLAAVEQLAREFPDDQRLELERLSLLRNQTRREDRLTTYERLCAKKESHPIFWQQYAQELRADDRRWEDARSLLRRAIARWPSEGANYMTLAYLYWDRRRYDEALELHRIAACLGDKDEQLVMAYFSAADWFKQTDVAFAMLKDRFARFGRKSSDPARTLSSAYTQLDRYGEALEVVEEALRLRPDDGELMLYAADLYSASSLEYLPRTRELVESARGKVPRAQWLRTAARLATSEDRFQDALALWREVVELAPLAVDAHTAVARLLFSLAGDAAAQRHLAETCERFPHHIPLHELWVEWIRDEPAEVREPIVRKLIEAGADNAWAHRELGFLLGGQRRFDEAWRECEIAGRLEPNNPSQFLLQARLLRAGDKLAEAKTVLRAALESSIDNDAALAAWMELCETIAERREVLSFVQTQLEKQVIYGDGLLAFREHAATTLDADELLERLRAARRHRPDLWHAWSALLVHLLDCNRLDEAWETACEATERFPLLPRLWLDRADVCRARLDWSGELEAVENAHRISPTWGTTVRRLGESLNQRGEYGRASELLGAAVARQPNDGATRTLYAETQWRLGQQSDSPDSSILSEALETVRTVVKLDPGQTRAWDLLQQWSDELECPEVPRATARALTESRPGDARSWLVLARILDQRAEVEERLAAYAKASELSPRNVEAYDLKAETLAALGRYDEALEALRPAAFGEHPPLSLLGRAAWVLAERGDFELAIERMRAVLSEEPFYFWGWSRLADWCQVVDDLDGYLEASQWLVKLSPQYEVSLGYLGEALLLKNRRAEALEVFERAFELNPRYEFAGIHLFDMHFADREEAPAGSPEREAALARAREVHDRLVKFLDGNLVDARMVQLAACEGRKGDALAALRRIVACPDRQPTPLNLSLQAVRESGWLNEAREILETSVFEGTPSAHVIKKWVELRWQPARLPMEEPLRKLMERARSEVTSRAETASEETASEETASEETASEETASEKAARLEAQEQAQELTRIAFRSYLEVLVEGKQAADLRDFLTRNDAWLRPEPTFWGLGGWAWTSLRDYQEAARWMHDWRTRLDALPWAHVNAVEGLRNTGREQEGAECGRLALTLPESNGLHLHHLWLASDAALAGDTKAARRSLETMHETAAGEPLDKDYEFLRVMVECLVDMQDAAPAQREAMYRHCHTRLATARITYTPFDQEPARQKIFRRTHVLLASLRGGWQGLFQSLLWRIKRL
jgi:tetratricopeptide (TPR) repeat protein